MTDVRETTRSSRIRARLVRISSWTPSEKKPLSLSSLMLVNGRTAMDLSSFAKAPEDTVAVVCFAAGSGGGTTGAGWRRKIIPATAAMITVTNTPHIHPGTAGLALAAASAAARAWAACLNSGGRVGGRG